MIKKNTPDTWNVSFGGVHLVFLKNEKIKRFL